MQQHVQLRKRLFWSLMAGVLLVPLVAAGAFAGSSADSDSGNHAKEGRETAEVRVVTQRPASNIERVEVREPADHPDFESITAHRIFHGVNFGIDHSDHPVFDTPGEHKAFHGVSFGIDHSDHPVFDTPGEHRAFHGVEPTFVREDTRDEASPRDEASREAHGVRADDPVAEEVAGQSDATTDDGAPSAVELKEQPLEGSDTASDDTSTTEKPTRRHDRDRSERNEESRSDRSN